VWTPRKQCRRPPSRCSPCLTHPTVQLRFFKFSFLAFLL
jgi:hypothetical protein